MRAPPSPSRTRLAHIQHGVLRIDPPCQMGAEESTLRRDPTPSLVPAPAETRLLARSTPTRLGALRPRGGVQRHRLRATTRSQPGQALRPPPWGKARHRPPTASLPGAIRPLLQLDGGQPPIDRALRGLDCALVDGDLPALLALLHPTTFIIVSQPGGAKRLR